MQKKGKRPLLFPPKGMEVQGYPYRDAPALPRMPGKIKIRFRGMNPRMRSSF